MNRQLARRAPKRNGGFSWGRFPIGETGRISYRLFRRDHTGTVHMSTLVLEPWAPRWVFSAQLRTTCHGLRDLVDEIDLAGMGVGDE